jgi:hypothetical protein
MFNAVFDPSGGRTLGDSSALDEVLATYDPSEHDSAIKGRSLHAAIATPDLRPVLPENPEPYFEEEAEALSELTIDAEPARGMPDYRQQVIALSHSIQRKLYLVGADELGPAFALATMDDFLSIAQAHDPGPEVVSRLIRNLNSALGVSDAAINDLLSPRDYSRGLQGRGFAMLIPQSRFVVRPGTSLGAPFAPNTFMEAWPRSLLLEARDASKEGGHNIVVATLVIPLLLFELLDKAGRGFRPAGQTERAYMVRLRGFYRLLSEHRWSSPPEYALFDAGRVIGKAQVDGDRFALMGV